MASRERMGSISEQVGESGSLCVSPVLCLFSASPCLVSVVFNIISLGAPLFADKAHSRFGPLRLPPPSRRVAPKAIKCARQSGGNHGHNQRATWLQPFHSILPRLSDLQTRKRATDNKLTLRSGRGLAIRMLPASDTGARTRPAAIVDRPDARAEENPRSDSAEYCNNLLRHQSTKISAQNKCACHPARMLLFILSFRLRVGSRDTKSRLH